VGQQSQVSVWVGNIYGVYVLCDDPLDRRRMILGFTTLLAMSPSSMWSIVLSVATQALM
jgi:hypothetical protein